MIYNGQLITSFGQLKSITKDSLPLKCKMYYKTKNKVYELVIHMYFYKGSGQYICDLYDINRYDSNQKLKLLFKTGASSKTQYLERISKSFTGTFGRGGRLIKSLPQEESKQFTLF